MSFTCTTIFWSKVFYTGTSIILDIIVLFSFPCIFAMVSMLQFKIAIVILTLTYNETINVNQLRGILSMLFSWLPIKEVLMKSIVN